MYYRLLKHNHINGLSRFRARLKVFLRGLTILKSLPAVVFFNSVKHSYCATGEAYALHIPSGGLTDSDALPDSVLYPIPGNDDAFGSIFFLNKLIAKMVLISKIEMLVTRYKKFCEDMLDLGIRLALARLRRIRKRRREQLRLLRLLKNKAKLEKNKAKQ